MYNYIEMEYDIELGKITPYKVSTETFNKIADMTDEISKSYESTANISCRVYKHGLIYINRKPFSVDTDIVFLLFQEKDPFNIKIIMTNNSVLYNKNTRYMKDMIPQDSIRPYSFNDFAPISELIHSCRKIIIENEKNL